MAVKLNLDKFTEIESSFAFSSQHLIWQIYKKVQKRLRQEVGNWSLVLQSTLNSSINLVLKGKPYWTYLDFVSLAISLLDSNKTRGWSYSRRWAGGWGVELGFFHTLSSFRDSTVLSRGLHRFPSSLVLPAAGCGGLETGVSGGTQHEGVRVTKGHRLHQRLVESEVVVEAVVVGVGLLLK